MASSKKPESAEEVNELYTRECAQIGHKEQLIEDAEKFIKGKHSEINLHRKNRLYLQQKANAFAKKNPQPPVPEAPVETLGEDIQ